MNFSPLLDELIESLRYLPGVGPKTAQRMAFSLLKNNREAGTQLAKNIEQAMQKIGHCERCRTFSETPICHLCENPRRDASKLCVVETPADILAIEQTGIYHGYYFVLMGHLSPLDGIGPTELGLTKLREHLQASIISEVILSLANTVEGEATVHYLIDLIKPLKKKITRLAHGIPSGGELEFIDGRTLSYALQERIPIEVE